MISSKVIFLNQPKLSEHLVDEELNKKRLELISEIEKYIKNNAIFSSENIKVTFFHVGFSSLVCLLELPKENYVLKIQLRIGGARGEDKFLKAWEDVGVLVPHIYENGIIAGHFYFLMKYVDALTLDKAYSEKDLVEKKMFYKMGQTLRLMHTVQAVGYGRMNENGEGEHSNFDKWFFENQQTKNQLGYVKEHNLLPEEVYGSLDKAREKISAYVSTDPRSVYCHYDFSPVNIFATDPLTVFDPAPMFNHPYLDVGKCIVQTLVQFPLPEVVEQVLDGYFGGSNQIIDPELLQSIILFISHTKFAYWHKTKKIQSMENIKNYLLLHK